MEERTQRHHAAGAAPKARTARRSRHARHEQLPAQWTAAPLAEPEHSPGLSRGHVPRPRLVAPLEEPSTTPLILIAAPAGYGKTALVEEWARSDRRRFLWLTLDEDDNEPERLVRRVGAVLQPALSGPKPGPAGRVSLAGTPEEREPFVLVLDGVHSLLARPALALLRRLVDHVPRASQLVLVARRPPRLPLARLRAQRVLTELGSPDLAMTRSEAGALLEGCGVTLRRGLKDLLVAKAEGWPAALYLAAISLRQFPAGAATRC